MSEEKVIMEAKLDNSGIDERRFKLNREQAMVDIAKSLIQDFTFTLTISVIKMVLGGIDNSEKLVNALYQVWEKRTSAQLAEEEKRYQDSISEAFSNQKDISEDVSKKIETYMKNFCEIRDKAVEIAKGSIQEIMSAVVERPSTEETKNETK